VLVRAFDKSARRKPLARRTRWGYGNCMWARRDAAQMASGERTPTGSESSNRAVRMCCRVVALVITKHVKL